MGARCYHVRFLNSPAPVSLSHTHDGDICDGCKREGYRSPTADDGDDELVIRLGKRFASLFDAGRMLLVANITEEDKIIPTLAFAATISEQPDFTLL